MSSKICLLCVFSAAVCLSPLNSIGQAGTASEQKSAPVSQGVTAASDPPIFKSEGDFTYNYPADWQVVDMKPMLPVQRLKMEQQATSDMERKGADCTDVQLTIRHGDPASVILIMFLEYKCLGLELKESDLGSTGMGIAQGLTKSFNVKDPKYGAYGLGKHAFWIERADGSVLNHPERQYKLETACTMLKKGLACWIVLAGTPDAITTFEASQVSLEGDAAIALVPTSAFAMSR